MSTIDPSRRRWRSLATASAVALATITPAVGLAGIGAAPAQAAGPDCVNSGLVTTCTFTYTGEPQSWTVPAGVSGATFEVVGASGGRGVGLVAGGLGGGVKATVPLNPNAGDKVQIDVGSAGEDVSGRGGWGGPSGWSAHGGNGASADSPAGGGVGGASVVHHGRYVGGDFLFHTVLVGGGGGGAGSDLVGCNPYCGKPGVGGNGGGAAPGGGAGAGDQGMNGYDSIVTAGGGYGGTTTRGAGGGASGGHLWPGCSFWTEAHALPGEKAYGSGGGAGGHLNTVNGTACMDRGAFGGGGGGGLRGGGGGGSGVSAGAGGGGGSGYGPAGSTNFLGQPGADGVVKVTYLNPNMSQFVDLGGTILGGDPTISKRVGSANVFDLFYIDTQGYARQRTYTDYVPAAGDTQIGTKIFYPGSSLAAVSWGPNRIDLFGRGVDNSLLHAVWDGVNWSSWMTHTWVGKITGNPTVASWGPGRLDIFAPSANGNLLHEAWNPGWAWEFLPGPVENSPAAVSRGPNQIDVFYGTYAAGSGTTLRWKRWDGSNGGWQPEIAVSADAMKSSPTVSSPAAGVLNVFYQGTAGLLVKERYDADGWVRTGYPGTPFTEATVPASLSVGPSKDIVMVRSPATNTVWGRVL